MSMIWIFVLSDSCLCPFTSIRRRACVCELVCVCVCECECVRACQSVTFSQAHGLWPVLILLWPELLPLSAPSSTLSPTTPSYRSVLHTLTNYSLLPLCPPLTHQLLTLSLPPFRQQAVAKCRICLFLYILSFSVPAHVPCVALFIGLLFLLPPFQQPEHINISTSAVHLSTDHSHCTNSSTPCRDVFCTNGTCRIWNCY
jgi:hypothetical protein